MTAPATCCLLFQGGWIEMRITAKPCIVCNHPAASGNPMMNQRQNEPSLVAV